MISQQLDSLETNKMYPKNHSTTILSILSNIMMAIATPASAACLTVCTRNHAIASKIQADVAINDPKTGCSNDLFRAGKNYLIKKSLEGYEQTPCRCNQYNLERVRLIALRGGRISPEQERQLHPDVVTYIAQAHAIRARTLRKLFTDTHHLPNDLQRLICKFSDDLFDTIKQQSDVSTTAQNIEQHRQSSAVYWRENTGYENIAEDVEIEILLDRADKCDFQTLQRNYQGNISAERLFVALCLAAEQGKIMAAKRLIDLGASINGLRDGNSLLSGPSHYPGTTPLMVAAMCSRVTMLQFLLAHGAWPNVRNQNSDTALHYAVETGCKATVGADPNVVKSFDRLPLHIALNRSWHSNDLSTHLRLSIAQQLLDAGSIDLEQVDPHGFGLLDACYELELPIIKWLAQRGALINHACFGHSGLMCKTLRNLNEEWDELDYSDKKSQLANELWIQKQCAILQELAGRGARLDSDTLRDKDLGPLGRADIECAHADRQQAIDQALAALNKAPHIQQLICKFSDDERKQVTN